MRFNKEKPDFKTIADEKNGDTGAITKILNHYGAYILIASSRKFISEFNVMYTGVDFELRGLIISEVITAILGFDVKTIKYPTEPQ